MKLHTINHGSGPPAKFLTNLDGKEAEAQFNELASVCFGLRKNNLGASIVRTEDVGDFGAIIEHAGVGGDLIVFDSDGKKVRSEYDLWGSEQVRSITGDRVD